MAPKIKRIEDCSTGREFQIYAQQHEDDCRVRITKNGSYLKFETPKGSAYVPDSDRPMAKPSRSLIVQAFRLIGLAAIILTVLAAAGVL